MKTSNKLILLILAILIGLVPVSVYFLKTGAVIVFEKTKKKTKISLEGEINCIVAEDLRGYCFRISPGKNSIEIPQYLKDSIVFECRRDTLFIKEKSLPKPYSPNRGRYVIPLKLMKCPSIMAKNGTGIQLEGFKDVKNQLKFNVYGGNLSIDSLSADSIGLELHQGQYATLGKNTKFNFVSVKATDSTSITLNSKDIKTIRTAIEPLVYVNGMMRNINKLASKN